MRHTPAVLAALACLALTFVARADSATLDADAAKVCAACLDDYLIVPDYQANCGSSRGVKSEDVRRKYTADYPWHQNGKIETRSTPPDDAEVRAADALRSLTPGDYGWLQSVEVVKVAGDRDMLVKALWLTDPKATAEELKKTIAKINDTFAQSEQVLKADAEAKIAKLENERKSTEAWATAGGGNSGSVSGGSSGAGAIQIKVAQISAQIKDLNTQKSAALKEFSANKTEALKIAKQRLQARHDAVQLQGKLRKDLNKTFRLTGFATANLRARDRFAGPKDGGLQVAVAWQDKTDGPVLANVALLQKPLDQAGLRALLLKRGVKPADFALQMANAKKGKDPDAAARAAREAMAQWIRSAAPTH